MPKVKILKTTFSIVSNSYVHKGDEVTYNESDAHYYNARIKEGVAKAIIESTPKNKTENSNKTAPESAEDVPDPNAEAEDLPDPNAEAEAEAETERDSETGINKGRLPNRNSNDTQNFNSTNRKIKK